MAQMAQTIFIFNDKKPRLYCIQYILARHLPVLQRSIKSVSGSARIHDRATKRAGFFFLLLLLSGQVNVTKLSNQQSLSKQLFRTVCIIWYTHIAIRRSLEYISITFCAHRFLDTSLYREPQSAGQPSRKFSQGKLTTVCFCLQQQQQEILVTFCRSKSYYIILVFWSENESGIIEIIETTGNLLLECNMTGQG